MAKFYSNTMLLILNNRITVVGGREEVTVGKPLTRWQIHKRSQGEEPELDERGKTYGFHEVWRDHANSDCLEVVSTSAIFNSEKCLITCPQTYTPNKRSNTSRSAEIFSMTPYSSSSTNPQDSLSTDNT